MSETDDTDDLLLIPPDFFLNEAELIETYTSGPYLGIVDTLITQIHQLEDRVNCIENTDLTLIGSSLDLSVSERGVKMDDSLKFNSSNNLQKLNDPYMSSAFSTPQKPRTRYKMNSLPTTPNSPLKVRSSYAEHRKQMLKDIDNYINNSEEPQTSAKCKLDYNKKQTIEVNGKIINLTEIENLLKDMEAQKLKTEERFRDKEEEILTQKHTWRNGDDLRTIPRREYKNLTQFDKLAVNTANKLNSSDMSESALGDKSGSITSTDSSQVTTRRNQISPRTIKHAKSEDFKRNQELMSKSDHGDSFKTVGLLSLKDLWGKKSEEGNVNQILKEKLEEEKLRRQHCEQIILDLQARTLELQERLAVAIDVDVSKDNAILKFHDAWEQIAIRLNSLTRERDTLESDIQELQIKSVSDLAEVAKKISHYENEASKALNLAHSSQTKLASYEEQNKELRKKINEIEEQVKEAKTNYAAELDKNKQLNDVIVQKEIEIKDGKIVLSESRKEIAQSKKAVELCQAEFTNMKAQYTQLELLLNDKQAQIQDLEKQKKNICADNENLKLLYKNTEAELKKTKEQLDKNKIELRDFYQEQVEIVVKDKLKEFQVELDKTENFLKGEIKNRELAIAKTAALHIQQLSEKHSLEVNLLEEKHKEEVRLYQMQLSQSQQQIEHLQSKLKNYSDRRANIAQQLHKVMEAQWLEALKIINSGRSPYPAQDNTLDQLYSLKTKSYSNLEEVLSDQLDEPDKKLNGPAMPSISSNDDNQATYRLQETPLSSKLYRGRQQIENDLQKYVQMLMNKPASTLHGESLDVRENKLENPSNEKTWSSEMQDESKYKGSQSRRSSKPPWK